MAADPDADECVGRPQGLAQTIKAERCIKIGPDITVWVAWAQGGSARLVVKAPDDMKITRPRQDGGA